MFFKSFSFYLFAIFKHSHINPHIIHTAPGINYFVLRQKYNFII